MTVAIALSQDDTHLCMDVMEGIRNNPFDDFTDIATQLNTLVQSSASGIFKFDDRNMYCWFLYRNISAARLVDILRNRIQLIDKQIVMPVTIIKYKKYQSVIINRSYYNEFDYTSYQAIVEKAKLWCVKSYKEKEGCYDRRWYNNGVIFFFSDPKMALMFKLTWG